MSHPEPRITASQSTLLFGWQALSLDEHKLAALRHTINSSSTTSWIIDAVADLVNQLASLMSLSNDFHGRAEVLLHDLSKWLTKDGSYSADFVHYNLLLTPLTVIHHLAQYIAYLDLRYPQLDTDAKFSASQRSSKALGFCTGLFSAYAVSNAHDAESFRISGTLVIRMAMICGLVVDQESHLGIDTQTTALAIAWQSTESQQNVDRVLSQFPKAYCSVHFDDNRVTLTVPRHEQADIKKELEAHGLTQIELNLTGRFHWPGHKEAAVQVMSIINQESILPGYQSGMLVLPVSARPDPPADELHREVIRSVLLEAPDWYQSVSQVQQKVSNEEDSVVVTFGFEKFIPPSLIRGLRSKLINMAELEQQRHTRSAHPRPPAEMDIAVVGMSCKVAGANNLDEFWRILCEGKSQHRQVPEDRFTFNTPHRQSKTASGTWFGNFMDDHDAFDHKFFGKTPREVASMDPQQRQFLQIAYQAVEQSGYFRQHAPSKQVGCYVGLSTVDYEDNVACHAPNAYSATGTLRAFVAGKVSHFFGWTGPGLTLDTACSSSAVAVHLACQAILNGDCDAALAGGANNLTSPFFYQNLSSASFLSKTGQCKPFDAAADGYCRGEGCAAVFLKKLSTAVADGDEILGVITGTAVQQNENCTPIVVPNVSSLSNLFDKVIRKSQLRPEDISVVEAHGTGTAVGDPAEYESIRRILGGESTGRGSQLILGSVKGLVGHLESTSGIVSLIKALLMIKYSTIPPQASFKTLNPAIKARAADRITIPMTPTPWDVGLKAVLINNYGASGSNASMVIMEPPSPKKTTSARENVPEVKQPFRICAADDGSISAYAGKLRQTIQKSPSLTVGDISFNLARQANPSLPRAQIFTSRSLSELDQQLGALEKLTTGNSLQEKPSRSRPVVMCFGGQVSKSVALSRRLYDSVPLLKMHIDACDKLVQALGASSIFPHIFQQGPIGDIVILQASLFAVQYAAAQCWLDSGIRPVAVMGHSFGELTAMAVSGSLSLHDTLKMIVARARIVQDRWGSDCGGMMAVECSIEDAHLLVQATNAACDVGTEPLVIACYNGPRSFTLAGSMSAINLAAGILLSNKDLAAVKMKKLDVSHAFHSTLTKPLMEALDEAARGLTASSPTMEWARCTETAVAPGMAATFFSQHLRQPVYFDHCVRRLAARYTDAVWLEAGSSKSTITNMVCRTLGQSPNNTFIPLDLSSYSACDRLAETTTILWAAGVNHTHWTHHPTHSARHAHHILPPYQFAKSKHWLELKEPPVVTSAPAAAVDAEKVPETWLTFLGFQDGESQQHARFRINTSAPRFRKLMVGHKMAQTAPVCPATVQMDIVVDAMSQILPAGSGVLNPELTDICNLAPICENPAAQLWLDLRVTGRRAGEWQFTVSSTMSGAGSSTAPRSTKTTTTTTHTTGRIVPLAQDLSTEADLARRRRLVGHGRCLEVLDAADPDHVMQGRIIYKVFADVVDYDEQYIGVVKLVGKGSASAARVVKEPSTETAWFDAHLSDTFCQVGGMFINCMTDRDAHDLFICRGLERWMRSGKLQQARPESYNVLALHEGSVASGSFLTDVFVFHPESGALLEAIVGLNFVRVQKEAIARTLLRLTGASLQSSPVPTAPSMAKSLALLNQRASPSPSPDAGGLLSKLKALVAELSGVSADQILPHSVLADLGIDSLMSMELVTELDMKFRCHFSLDDAALVTDMNDLVALVRATTGGTATQDEPDPHRQPPTSHDTSEQDSASDNDTLFSTNTPAETVTSSGGVGVAAILAGVIGVDVEEVAPMAILRDLGVDSLLSMEIAAALESEYGVQLGEHLILEDMTVAELGVIFDGNSGPQAGNNPIPVPNAHQSSAPAAVVPVTPVKYDRGLCQAAISSPAAHTARQAAVDKYIDFMSSGFRAPSHTPASVSTKRPKCVLVTGGTGSLGSYLVANLATRLDVDQVFVLNRPHTIPATTRQLEAFSSRHIDIGLLAKSKLRVLATDTSKPMLGLSQADYAMIIASVTHIVHSAWTMSIKRSVSGFEAQFQIMRNLISLAREAASTQPNSGHKIHFQFVSSIAVVGHYPLRPGRDCNVPETRVDLADVLPIGYAEAKYACERALDETLHRYPDRFATSCVRIGQISGSSAGVGYWNPQEHVPFLLKSSQTLRCLPRLEGPLSWTPVDVVAGTLADIALLVPQEGETYPVYHVDNPVRQQWSAMLPVLADALRTESQKRAGGGLDIVSLKDWVKLVRTTAPQGSSTANPASVLIEFLEDNFERMSCGGLLLDTAQSQKHSPTMAATGPISDDLVRRYIKYWKNSGFLDVE